MSHQRLLIDGRWRSADDPVGSFNTVNPATEETLSHTYPISRFGELEEMLNAGRSAAQTLRTLEPDVRAEFLETFAEGIEARAEELVEWAHRETALAKSPRLANIELPRTTDQLRQAAEAVRARTWCEATIDTEANIRSRLEPLGGPVVVMGPNNFPFAFNAVSGGDFAAAIAAGNPVVAKAHPAHPETSRLLAKEGEKAAQSVGMPAATLQMFYHATNEAGRTLVAHDLTGATAFTGSQSAGMVLKEAADSAGNPIYLEMSSVNPVFLLRGALRERLDDLVDELATSCSLGAGQFCTNPGLVILPSTDAAETFTDRLASAFEEWETGTLFTADGPQQIADTIEVWQENGAELVTGGAPTEDLGFGFENTLLRVSGDTFLNHPQALQTEAFGTASLLVFADDVEQMCAIARTIEGNLTGGLFTHSEGDDDAAYEQIEPILRQRVGRVLNDKMPTGVAVSPAMVHGGPYPATGHAGFTAVGVPASLRRFAAVRCYDDVRAHRLPPELKDDNPTGEMWRFIDREWTQDDV